MKGDDEDDGEKAKEEEEVHLARTLGSWSRVFDCLRLRPLRSQLLKSPPTSSPPCEPGAPPAPPAPPPPPPPPL